MARRGLVALGGGVLSREVGIVSDVEAHDDRLDPERVARVWSLLQDGRRAAEACLVEAQP